jgi:hypothetical protein
MNKACLNVLEKETEYYAGKPKQQAVISRPGVADGRSCHPNRWGNCASTASCSATEPLLLCTLGNKVNTKLSRSKKKALHPLSQPGPSGVSTFWSCILVMKGGHDTTSGVMYPEQARGSKYPQSHAKICKCPGRQPPNYACLKSPSSGGHG